MHARLGGFLGLVDGWHEEEFRNLHIFVFISCILRIELEFLIPSMAHTISPSATKAGQRQGPLADQGPQEGDLQHMLVHSEQPSLDVPVPRMTDESPVSRWVVVAFTGAGDHAGHELQRTVEQELDVHVVVPRVSSLRTQRGSVVPMVDTPVTQAVGARSAERDQLRNPCQVVDVYVPEIQEIPPEHVSERIAEQEVRVPMLQVVEQMTEGTEKPVLQEREQQRTVGQGVEVDVPQILDERILEQEEDSPIPSVVEEIIEVVADVEDPGLVSHSVQRPWPTKEQFIQQAPARLMAQAAAVEEEDEFDDEEENEEDVPQSRFRVDVLAVPVWELPVRMERCTFTHHWGELHSRTLEQ